MKKYTIKGLLAAVLALSLSLPAGAQTPDLDAIKARGVLKVGVKVDVPKFGYKDAGTGVIDGFPLPPISAKRPAMPDAVINTSDVGGQWSWVTGKPVVSNEDGDVSVISKRRSLRNGGV